MKRVFSLITFVLVIVLFSCSSDDDKGEPTIPTDNSMNENPIDSDSIVISLEGVQDLNLIGAEVISTSSSSIIEGNRIPNIYDKDELDIPILIQMDGDVLIGYFPETIDEKILSIEDVLFFFFKTYPTIAIRGYENTVLEDLLFNSQYYDNLLDMLQTSLNKDESVIDNPNFDATVLKVLDESDAKIEKKDVEETFQIDYQIIGEVKIPSNSPIFSSLGVGIRTLPDSISVFEPILLKEKGLVLSPQSLINYLFSELVMQSETSSFTIQFEESSEYEVVISNGDSGFPELDEAVQNKNYEYFAVTALSYVLPFGLKKLSKKESCKDGVENLLKLNEDFIIDIILKEGSINADEIVTYLIGLGEQVTAITLCYDDGSGPFLRYVTSFISMVQKRLNIAEDIAELTLFLRDAYNSDITQFEKKSYFDNILVGDLLETKNSPIAFSGEMGEAFNYESKFEETIVKYDVDRGLTSTVFLEKTERNPASGLPFEYTVTDGDAIILDSNPIVTNENGTIDLEIINGADTSEIILIPLFNSSDVSNTIITTSTDESNNSGARLYAFIKDFASNDLIEYDFENLDEVRTIVTSLDSYFPDVYDDRLYYIKSTNEILVRSEQSNGDDYRFLKINLESGFVQTVFMGSDTDLYFNFDSVFIDQNRGKMYAFDNEGAILELVEYDLTNLTRVRTVASLESITPDIFDDVIYFVDSTNEVLVRETNSPDYVFYKINVNTGEIRTISTGLDSDLNLNFKEAFIDQSEGRLFAFDDSVSPVELIEYSLDNFTRIRTVAVLESLTPSIFDDVFYFVESSGEVILRSDDTSFGYEYIRINIETGEVSRVNKGQDSKLYFSFDTVVIKE